MGQPTRHGVAIHVPGVTGADGYAGKQPRPWSKARQALPGNEPMRSRRLRTKGFYDASSSTSLHSAVLPHGARTNPATESRGLLRWSALFRKCSLQKLFRTWALDGQIGDPCQRALRGSCSPAGFCFLRGCGVIAQRQQQVSRCRGVSPCHGGFRQGVGGQRPPQAHLAQVSRWK